MQKKSLRMSLLQEEKRSTILFLWLFYIVFFFYDLFYYYLLPITPWSGDFTNSAGLDINYIKYIVIFGLIPITVYLIKKNKPESIKYILFLTYISVNLLTDIWYYWGSDISYSSGNLVELVIILFSPIFINKRFFYLVSIGSIFKYILLGLILHDHVVLIPILFNFILSIIAYILLHRFLNYVEALKQSYDLQIEGIVKGVIATLELKDPYTRGHSERVAEYAMSLAKATGKFKDYELKHFYYACLLHDIGKVNIPDSILTKPSKLTDEEYELIKTHPAVGAKAVQGVEGIDGNIDVIYHHHERWDGKGYPDGLERDEIPLLARITAIADAFDAMTSSRSYRSALSFEEAYKRILDGKGTQFDPQLVNTFQQVYPSWVDFHKDYHSK
ncbi:HD-GYP domain-containing protein [Bacillus niameyensis]|uniref:HD-GYP domain-containing protein n=1 Tax=Bacillus niameyensis TaxID=1522308 RepID=UPI000785A475|nr:HD-GYP domain-containing protein [Bacillus niameyensis]